MIKLKHIRKLGVGAAVLLVALLSAAVQWRGRGGIGRRRSRRRLGLADTLMVAPGQRFDILVNAVYPGVWAFHCHILRHVEGPEGMYGMVTALVVQ